MTNRLTSAVPRLHVRIELIAISLLAVAIASFGYVFYNFQRDGIEQEVHQHLREVVTLKVAEISAWRSERLGDARVAAILAGVTDEAALELENRGNGRASEALLRWLDAIRGNYGYASVALADATGSLHLVSGVLPGPPEAYRAVAREATLSGSPAFHEMAPVNGISKPHIVLTTGLVSRRGTQIGALLLVIDPAVYLYPSVLRWPVPTRTGQVILIQRNRDDVVFLSNLEGVPGSAMTLRRSLSNRTSISVRAAMGETEVDGTIGGANGPAEQVEGAARRVPDSNWFVLANMHSDEAYERLPQIRRAILLMGGMFLLLVTASIEILRRRQQSKFYLRLYEAELEKQALRGHYDFLTRYANDAILLSDDQFRIVEVNDRACEYFGYTREEFMGLEVSTLRTPELRPSFGETWSMLRAKKSLLYELEVLRKDGSRFPAEASARVIEVEGKQLIQSILRDITERKQAEEQIRRLNRLYLVLSRCSEAVVEARTEQELLERVCGIAVEQGGLRAALVHISRGSATEVSLAARAGLDMRFLDAALFDAFGSNQAFAICNDIPAEAGLILWKSTAVQHEVRSWIALPLTRGRETAGRLSLFSSSPSFFSADEIALAQEIAGSISFALDAQEREHLRRRAEQQLSASRERLELVLDSTNEGYWDWNLATGDGHQSLRYYAILGYEPGELRADFQTWQSLAHEDDQAAVRAVMEAMRTQDSFSAELRVRSQPGGYIWCLWRGKVVTRDGEGMPVRLVGTITDITEKKRLEEQFRQAQKLESIGRLAGGIAHDFNNLLTVINGYGDLMLARMSAADALRPTVRRIREAGESAAELTRQLLTFSRKQISNPKPLSLNAVVEEAKTMLGRLVGEHIQVITRLLAAPDRVLADRSQIHQCLMNLVVNARDAMPDGGMLIIETGNAEVAPADLVSEAEPLPGAYVVLMVTDTGTGMDEATRSHIFEPFFTTKEMGKGTGLGLATVYGIVRQCNGFIRVESEPGLGSWFRVYLPLTESGERTDSAAVPVVTAGTGTLLVVEDQDGVREFLAETLTDLGYSVLAARSGEEAIQIARQHPATIDLLLSDLVMPGINGRELARNLQSLRPSLTVVFMSGYAGDVIGNQPVSERGVVFLQKPFTSDALAAKLREVLAGRASPAAAD